MTTTANLRAHLAAHGVDGPPIESGWYVALFIGGEVGIVFCDGRGGIAGAGTAAASWVVKIGREMSIVDGERAARCGSFFAYNIASHAPLSIATTDLSAEVARLQSGRDGRWAMTTTWQLREYLDAHGVDGEPTEPGWYVAEFANRPVVVCVHRESWGMSFRTGAQHVGSFIDSSSMSRHAPLAIAPTADRGIVAEVARLQSEVDALRAIIESGARGREPCEVCGA